MNRRLAKVNEILREEISHAIMTELKDPRLPSIISITSVKASADLRHARVYVSVLASKEVKDKSLEIINMATGVLRRSLRGRLSLKSVPDLTFVLDESIENGVHLMEMLQEALPNPATQEKA